MRETPAYWYGEDRGAKYYLLIPVSWLFCAIVWIRRTLYSLKIFRSRKAKVPVIVIGNITVGGSGKTPLVIWLANFLKEQGYKPGLVSRGYGGQAKQWPQQVRHDSDYVAVGDEPVMLASRTECPMAVGPDRPQVIDSLLEHHDIDVIISDDGLQHYAMQRDIEVAVVNGERRYGNRQCLPAGPLRERISRLDKVDMVVVNGKGLRHEHPMTVSNRFAVNMLTKETKALSDFRSMKVHAVAGVGYPDRFFNSLREAGLDIEPHPFADHYRYEESDMTFDDKLPVMMTEKDAVKCVRFLNDNLWCVPASVTMGNAFGQRLLLLLEKAKNKNTDTE